MRDRNYRRKQARTHLKKLKTILNSKIWGTIENFKDLVNAKKWQEYLKDDHRWYNARGYKKKQQIQDTIDSLACGHAYYDEDEGFTFKCDLGECAPDCENCVFNHRRAKVSV